MFQIMKLSYRFLISLLFLISIVVSKAQGWPANYEGVMLQGFFWDSYYDTKWTNLEKQSDELSAYFDLIWIPNSGYCNPYQNMGYMPQYWFTNHNSSFGTEAELRKMIKTFAAKGTGIIEDVVVNHRNGMTSWTDFPVEEWNGETWEIGPEGICRDDEVAKQSGQPKPTGNYDTGDNFDGARDLDHTNENVQYNIKNYCKFLLEDLGYTGFRYDMVKGYAPQYTKIYNEYSKPQFSVGEYWDSSYDNVAKWIDGTDKTSAAFDFPCKYQINKAFTNGMNLNELMWKANYITPQPAGMIHYGYARYAVTFVDNHDTYRDNSRFPDNEHIQAANAFILSSPGTPCVFLPHYKEYKAEIQAMINARKSAGVHNMSAVNVLQSTSDCYMAVVEGTRGSLAVKIGTAWVSPEGFSEGDIYTFGNDYCIWVKSDGSYVPPAISDPKDDTITIYYDNKNTKFKPVYCYTYADNSDNSSYSWPGKQMTLVGGDVYSVTIPAGSNAVFNTGSNQSQTVNVENVVDGYIYTGLSKDNDGKFTVDAGQPYSPEEVKDPDNGNTDVDNPQKPDQDDTEKEDSDKKDDGNVSDQDKDKPDTGDNNNNNNTGNDNNTSDGEIDGGEDSNPGDNQGSVDDPAGNPSDGNENQKPEDQPGNDNNGPGADNDPDNGSVSDDDQTGDNVGNEGGDTGDDENNVTPDDNLGGSNENETPDIENPDAGIEGIEIDVPLPEYYTLQGFKVKNPGPGTYIKVTGNQRTKIVIR